MERQRPGREGQPPPEERLAATLRTLEEGITAIIDGEQFRRYLDAMSRFHHYSASNIMLILAQRPEATHVAGYRRWQQLGRQVRKGERGIRILVPRTRVVELDEGEEETIVRGFGVGSVFDISQTDGEPLPEPPRPAELEGEHARSFWLCDQLRDELEERGVLLTLDELHGPKGIYQPLLRRVRVQAGMSADQTAKTLCHETAHVVAGHASGLPRQDAETVAEAASFVVLRHYGVDTSSYSFPYIAGWAEDRQVLTRNLVTIQQVSDTLITSIEERSRYSASLSRFRPDGSRG